MKMELHFPQADKSIHGNVLISGGRPVDFPVLLCRLAVSDVTKRIVCDLARFARDALTP